MIAEVHQSLLTAVREGLKEILSPEAIYIGEGDEQTAASIGISNTGFTFLEQGIGGSTAVSMKRVDEEFNIGEGRKEFVLKQDPLHAPVSVASPGGIIYKESNDFAVDYENKIIRFFNPPENPENRLIISYAIKKGSAEIKLLTFNLSYLFTVSEKSIERRDELVLSLIKALYLQRKYLLQHGLDDFVLFGGDALNTPSEKGVYSTLLEYQVKATIKIEIPVPPVERIEIRERK